MLYTGKIKFLLILICLSIIWHPKICAQKKFLGVPIIEHFEPNDFKGFPISADITQDSRGIIYIANPLGLLVYDGSNWEQHYSFVDGDGMLLSAICVDPTGRIYVGSREKDIGYYFPGANGQYEYQSLNHLLTDRHPDPGNWISGIYQYKNGYVFTSESNLYFYRDDTIKNVEVNKYDGYNTCVSNGVFYMNKSGQGLVYLNGEDWVKIPRGSFFANLQVMDLIHLSEERMLLFTLDNGIYLVENDKITPFASDLLEDFTKGQISTALKLSDGTIALCTHLGDLFILNQRGDLVYHFRRGVGFIDDSPIQEIFQDYYGNIWLARNNGLDKIEWQSPISLINDDLGLPGSGIRALATQDRIYFGTEKGLYYAEKNQPMLQIHQIDNIKGWVTNIQQLSGDIIVSTEYGAYHLVNDTFKKIALSHGNWQGFRKTKNPDIIIGGHDNGISRLERNNGRWAVSNKYDFDLWTYFFEFDETDRLWTTSLKDVFSFTFSDNYKKVISKNHYDTTSGLTSSPYKSVYKVGQEVIFSSKDGIHIYDYDKEKFKPSPTWNSRFADNIFDIYEMYEDPFGNIYYADTQGPGRLRKNKWNSYTNEYSLFNNVRHHLQRGMTKVSILDENNVLFAIPDGYVHYNNKFQQTAADQAKLLIRKVKLSSSDSILFGGNFVDKNKVVHQQPTGQVVSLPYNDNSLVFNYSLVEFNKNYSQYRHKLEGFDEKWSKWTTDTKKEYTNLFEGDYTFKVQTRDSNNQLSPETTYQFTIRPPWHRTNLAYGGYLLGFFGFSSLIFLGYQRKKKNEIGELYKEKLESEVQHKKSQLAASTMHLIDKSEFIHSIKDQVREILKQDRETNVYRQLKRIVKEIDRNNHNGDNWEDFEIHFDEVHEDFLQRIRKDYPEITAREVRLCAYLRMNLSTKEIADLLRISVRGVEVARYRLRKKLDIRKEENLVDYMMSY